MSKPYKRKDSPYYWIAPWIEGRQVPQSTKTTDYDSAERQLRILEGRIASGAPIHANTDRGTFLELLKLVEADYAAKERESIYDLKKRIELHLSPLLGHLPAKKISTGILNEYIASRRQEKAAKASINRELAIVKRAYTLGIREGLVSAKPYIEMLPEDNARQGFFTPEAFTAVLTRANPLLKDILTVCYFTGWRIESVLSMEWRNVDLTRGAISLTAQQTKNRKATVFPLDGFPDLKAVFTSRSDSTKETERRKTMKIPYVFHREGQRVISIQRGWEIARRKAGQPGRKIHDLRRTAVMNLEELGWSETEIMEMCGIKTRSIFTRYNITTTDRILAKSKRLAQRGT